MVLVKDAVPEGPDEFVVQVRDRFSPTIIAAADLTDPVGADPDGNTLRVDGSDTYVVAEPGSSGYELTSVWTAPTRPVQQSPPHRSIGPRAIPEFEVTVPGATVVTCVLTNEAVVDPVITIETVEVPDTGLDFEYEFVEPLNAEFDQADGESATETVPLGDPVDIRQVEVPGYVLSIECTEDASGDPIGTVTGRIATIASLTVDATCVFTNARLGRLTLVKNAEPETSLTFPVEILELRLVSADQIIGTGTISDPVGPDPDGTTVSGFATASGTGTYVVSEGVVGSYVLDDVACTDTSGATVATSPIGTSPTVAAFSLPLTLTDNVTCVLTNRVPPPTTVDIEITKEIDLGGTAVPTGIGTFPIEITGTDIISGGGTVDLADGESTTVTVVEGSEVTITETDPRGFDVSIECGSAPFGPSITLTPVVTATDCTITNSATTVEVTKDVVGADPGLSWDFTVTPALVGTGTFSLADGETSVAIVPTAGDTTVTEDDPHGYTVDLHL